MALNRKTIYCQKILYKKEIIRGVKFYENY